jgi:hypothetical protein
MKFGVEIETLVRPKFEEEQVKNIFKRMGWNFARILSTNRDLRNNLNILREVVVEKLLEENIPAHLKRRDYSKWIVDRDGSIFEERDEDGFKPFRMIQHQTWNIRD